MLLTCFKIDCCRIHETLQEHPPMYYQLLENQQTFYGMNVQLENLTGKSYWGKKDVLCGSQASVDQVYS